MAPHSSTLAWKIPQMEEPGGLQSMGSLRVGHDWATSLSCMGEGNDNPLQCSCLENARDGGAWWAAIYGVAQSQTWLKRLSSSRDYHTKWNKSEKDKYHVISLICGNSYITQWTYLQNKSRLIDMENRLMVARRRVLEDGWSGRLSLAIYVSYYLWNG